MGAVGIKSRVPITEGKVVVTAQHLAGTVPLRAVGTRPGEKRQRKCQGTDTYPALALLMVMD